MPLPQNYKVKTHWLKITFISENIISFIKRYFDLIRIQYKL